MLKKSKKVWVVSLAAVVVVVLGVFFGLRTVETPTPMLTVTATGAIFKPISIEQRFLNETLTLFERAQIEDEHTEIVARKNNGESSIVLVIDGSEETILGYLDTSDSLAEITLNVSNENADIIVNYEVHTVFGQDSGTMQVALNSRK